MKETNVEPTKTELHLTTLLQTATPEQEVDGLAIEQFCNNLYSGIKIKWGDPKSSLNITFQIFKQWFQKISPKIGEVIVYDEMNGLHGTFIAIVKCVSIDKIIAGAMVSSASGLIPHDNDVPSEGYRTPTKEESDKIILELSEAGLEWNYKYNRIVEKQKPSNGSFVRVSCLDGSKGLGIFNEIKDGQVYMYCIKLLDQPIRFNMFEVIGKYDEVFFDMANNVDKKIIQKELEDVHKLWNSHLKRVEPVTLRSGKGQKYYFINDRLYVVQVHESLSNLDSKRYASGNYFRTSEEATEALIAIRKLLKIHHAKPEELLSKDDDI